MPHSTPRLLFCTPVQMSQSPLTLSYREETPRYHHFSQFYSYGDHELKFPGDMSAIHIYGRLEYIDTRRMTLCSIFFIKPFMIAYQAADPKCVRLNHYSFILGPFFLGGKNPCEHPCGEAVTKDISEGSLFYWKFSLTWATERQLFFAPESS